MSGYDYEEEAKPVDERLQSLMKFFKKEVKGAERLSLVNAGMEVSTGSDRRRPQQQKEKKSSTDNIPTAAGLFSAERATCIFCDKQHDSKECGKANYMTLKDKKSRIETKRVCYTCLKPGHGSKKCKAFIKCIVCDKKHLSIMCPELSKVREGAKSSSSSAESQKDKEDVFSGVTCTGTVILQTLRVLLVGSKGTKVVRALMDSGSQRSYVLDSTAREIGLDSIAQQTIVHSVFGGASSEATPQNLH
jgi:hypothetical protein